jgi:hypothetical protein
MKEGARVMGYMQNKPGITGTSGSTEVKNGEAEK